MSSDRCEPGVGLGEPGYWLVAGLEWPGDTSLAEAAFATAPALIPREAVSHDVYRVLGCADFYAGKHAARVVFFSDLTRILATAGRTWPDLGVDWQAALSELQQDPYPALFLTINERVHLLICDPAASHSEGDQDDGHDWVSYERELLRQAITDKLATDWPAYMNGLIKSGRARLTD